VPQAEESFVISSAPVSDTSRMDSHAETRPRRRVGALVKLAGCHLREARLEPVSSDGSRLLVGNVTGTPVCPYRIEPRCIMCTANARGEKRSLENERLIERINRQRIKMRSAR